MIDIGRDEVPPSSSTQWDAWSRPIAAFLRSPRTAREVERFCRPLGARATKAVNLLNWLDLHAFAVISRGVYSLTESGRRWLCGYELAPELLAVPERQEEAAEPASGIHFVGRARDLSHDKIGRLQPRRIVRRDPHGGVFWACDCACGTLGKEVSSRHLLRRDRPVLSCGCLRSELAREACLRLRTSRRVAA